MRSMKWQLETLGNISAFTFRHRETKKNLCRCGRSQDLPNTDFQPAVRHLNKKKKCTHSTTNKHKITTQQVNYKNTHSQTKQLHTRQLKTSNKPPETSYNITCTTNRKNTQAKQYCVQFSVVVFLQSLYHPRFHPSLSLLLT